MSDIFWVMVISFSGYFGMPHDVEVKFDTKKECIATARKGVEVKRGNGVVVNCEPRVQEKRK